MIHGTAVFIHCTQWFFPNMIQDFETGNELRSQNTTILIHFIDLGKLCFFLIYCGLLFEALTPATAA